MSTPRDRGIDAQEAAVAHLDALAPYADGADWDDDDTDPDAMPDTAGPWCGCDTCTIREALAAAWPHAIAYAADLLDQADVAPYTGAAELLRAEAARATLAGQDVPA